MAKRKRRAAPDIITLVTVKPRCEMSVVRAARAVGIKAYSPRLLERGEESPLFPGYVFVWIVNQCWRAVLLLKGVLRFVLFDGKPALVREADINRFKAVENPYGYIILTPPLREGQQVAYGAENVLGIFKGYDEERRCKVLFEILGGRHVEMSVPQADLKAA